MKIEVLEPGCSKCEKLYAEAQKAVAETGVEAELTKVVKIEQIITYGVMMTPALVIDGKVKCSGKVARAAEIAAWLAE